MLKSIWLSKQLSTTPCRRQGYESEGKRWLISNIIKRKASREWSFQVDNHLPCENCLVGDNAGNRHHLDYLKNNHNKIVIFLLPPLLLLRSLPLFAFRSTFHRLPSTVEKCKPVHVRRSPQPAVLTSEQKINSTI